MLPIAPRVGLQTPARLISLVHGEIRKIRTMWDTLNVAVRLPLCSDCLLFTLLMRGDSHSGVLEMAKHMTSNAGQMKLIAVY